MSAAHSYLASCPDIQAELENNYITCDSARLREPAPFTDFLLSPMNRGNLTQIVSPGGGKVKNIVLRYDQRILESSTTKPGTCTRSCVATTRRGDLTQSYTIDPCDYYQAEELIHANELAYACRDNRDIVNGAIQRLIDVVVRRIQTDVTTDAATLLGSWDSLVVNPDATTIASSQQVFKVPTLKSISSGDINPKGWQDVSFAMMQSNWCNGAMIFAGPTFYKYAGLMNAGCCASQGLDLGKIMAQYGFAVAYDKRVASVASGTTDGAWAVAPGALQLIHFEENSNLFDDVADPGGHNYKKQVIFDPKSGMALDLDVSDNCGALSIFVRGNYKVVSAPTDLYSSSDEMSGVTGFAAIKVVNT